MLKVVVPLEALKEYGFKTTTDNIWSYEISDTFEILVNILQYNYTEHKFAPTTDNIVRLYHYAESSEEEIEDAVTFPEVIYLMIKDGVIDVC